MNFQIQHGISLKNYFIQMTLLTANQDPIGCILFYFFFSVWKRFIVKSEINLESSFNGKEVSLGKGLNYQNTEPVMLEN